MSKSRRKGRSRFRQLEQLDGLLKEEVTHDAAWEGAMRGSNEGFDLETKEGRSAFDKAMSDRRTTKSLASE